MLSPLDVMTDNSGRITHFVHPDFAHESIDPFRVGEQINGGERIVHKGEEYDITPEGSLVHPGVELHETIVLGSGVRIGKGTVFVEMIPESEDPLDTITIGNGTRIEGTMICDPVMIGRFGVILANSIGPGTTIGDFVRIGPSTFIQSEVTIGEAAKVDGKAVVATNATIEHAVRIGYKSYVGPNSVLGHHCRVGLFNGGIKDGMSYDGPFVAAGKTVPPYARI